jgi:hypothetical protein
MMLAPQARAPKDGTGSDLKRSGASLRYVLADLLKSSPEEFAERVWKSFPWECFEEIS